MWFASSQGEKIPPTKKVEAVCPSCGSKVVARMGRIKQHHWAHAPGTVCPFEREAMTRWHYEWQQRWPADQREVTVGKHRADVKTDHWVVEFQHSSISLDDLQSREEHWGPNLIWVVNEEGIGKNLSLHYDWHNHTGLENLSFYRGGTTLQKSQRWLVLDRPSQGKLYLSRLPRNGVSRDFFVREITIDELVMLTQKPYDSIWREFPDMLPRTRTYLGHVYPKIPPAGWIFRWGYDEFEVIDEETCRWIERPKENYIRRGPIFRLGSKQVQVMFLEWTRTNVWDIEHKIAKLSRREKAKVMAGERVAGRKFFNVPGMDAEVDAYVRQKRKALAAPKQTNLNLM